MCRPLTLIVHCLDRVNWGDVHRERKPWQNQTELLWRTFRLLKDITKAITAHAVSGWEWSRLGCWAEAGGEQWRSTCQLYDAVPQGLPTDVMWINRWMTAGGKKRKKNGVKLISCPSLSDWDFSQKLRSLHVWPFVSGSMWPELLSGALWFALKRHISFWRRRTQEGA